MYRIEVSENVRLALSRHMETHPSLETRIQELEANPYASAAPTNIPVIGDYYVNSGRFCILFNVNDDDELVSILKIVQSAYLYKVLTGRIPATS